MQIKDQVRSFIIANFYVPDPSVLVDDASLIERGVLDSTGVLEIVGFLEDTFSIPVTDTDMVPENLDSIARICDFVERKKVERARAAHG
jgi:acyl carrier protein